MARSDVRISIANRIHRARCLHPHMTPTHAADFLGISVEQYLRLEVGENQVTGEQIVLLADLMNVQPSWFFDGLKDL